MPFSFVTHGDIGRFAEVVRRAGLTPADFELEEQMLDPQAGEIESRKGDLGVRCLRTEVVTAYPLGDGSDWVVNFAADVESGRFG